MSPLKLLVAAATGILALVSSSSAQTFAFTAVVDSIDSSSSAYAETYIGLAAGDSFSGVLVLDPAAPDYLTSDPALGRYFNGNGPQGSPTLYHASLTLSLPAGAVTMGGPVPDYTGVVVSPRITVADGISFTTPSTKFETMNGDSLNYYQNFSQNTSRSGLTQIVDLILNDPSGSVFGSDALPTSLVLSSFTTANLYYSRSMFHTITAGPSGITTTRENAEFTAHFTILTTVPEPTTSAICSLSCGFLLLSRRRRR